MGRYSIGVRVRDEDGDEGVIVGKSKGYRDVRYDTGIAAGLVITKISKSYLTPIATNDDTPAPAVQAQGGFKVGDRVKTSGTFSFDPTEGEVVGVYGGLIDVRVDGDTDGDGFGSRAWAYFENELTLLPTTPEWQPKVGDRVRNSVRGDGTVIRIVDEGAHVSYDNWLDGHDGHTGDGTRNCWWLPFYKLEPAETCVSADLTIGQSVTLAEPARITGFQNEHAHLALASGGTYTLPRAALVAA